MRTKLQNAMASASASASEMTMAMAMATEQSRCRSYHAGGRITSYGWRKFTQRKKYGREPPSTIRWPIRSAALVPVPATMRAQPQAQPVLSSTTIAWRRPFWKSKCCAFLMRPNPIPLPAGPDHYCPLKVGRRA